MFLNLMFPGQKTWKPYWVEIRDRFFLDISAEYAKEPFTSFHLGVLKVRPSKDYPDRPDVLEFYDGEQFTQTSFWVFTYDPFDILEFFKNVCNAYKEWRQTVTQTRTPVVDRKFEVKPPGFFAGNVFWTIQEDKILIGKQNQTPTVHSIQDVQITPVTNTSRTGYFKLTLKGQDPLEEKCMNMEDMKKLLDAVYTNRFILKYPAEEAAPAPVAEPAPAAE